MPDRFFPGPSDAEIQEIFKQSRQDEQDRRTLRGKYAPPSGACRVCGGRVTAEISFDYGDRIGGPPVPGHVSGWSCDDCKLVYRACPPPISSKAPPP